jgi:hypothetical protein
MSSDLEELLKKIYFSPGHAGSFSSARQIQRVLKNEYGVSSNLNVIQNWLQKYRSYNLHKSRIVNFKRNPIVAHYIDQQWQGDLLFLPDLAKFNDGYQIILVCIDVVSRYAWAEPMKNKTGKETSRAFETILKRSEKSRKPEKFQTDDGKEFFNSDFNSLMKKYGINHFSIPSDKKAAIAERFIKTLKQKIYKYLDVEANRKRYIDVLQDLVKSYNDSFHSKIKMAPSDVSAETESLALKNLYSKDLWEKPRETPNPDIKVGDTVRITDGVSPFIKNYKGRWTEELFQIAKIKNSSPRPLYSLRALNGEEVKGIFYEDEIQKVEKPSDDMWEIERIIKTKIVKRGRKKVKQYFVKWFGYPDSFNSWVDERHMRKSDE